MPWNKLLNLPDLLVVGEGEQFKNGHKNMSVQEGEEEFPPPAYTGPITDPRVTAFLKRLAIQEHEL